MTTFRADYANPHPSDLDWAPGEPVTTEHKDAVASIVLNWSAIDVMLGVILGGVYTIPPEHRGELLNGLGTMRKFQLVKKAYADDPDVETKNAVREFSWCMEKLKKERDIIAHGALMFDRDGSGSFTSTKNFQSLPLASLPIALDNSRYCLEVIQYLVQHGLGREGVSLRARPSKLAIA